MGLKKQDGVQTSPVVTTDSKTWDNRDLNIITDNRGHKDNMKHPLMNISEQFRCSTRGGGDSLIIGAGDYNPSRCSGSKKEWEALEKRAVAGIRGVIRENFNPSVLVMDHDTDNSHIPLCVVNGKLELCLCDGDKHTHGEIYVERWLGFMVVGFQ